MIEKSEINVVPLPTEVFGKGKNGLPDVRSCRGGSRNCFLKIPSRISVSMPAILPVVSSGLSLPVRQATKHPVRQITDGVFVVSKRH